MKPERKAGGPALGDVGVGCFNAGGPKAEVVVGDGGTRVDVEALDPALTEAPCEPDPEPERCDARQINPGVHASPFFFSFTGLPKSLS